MSQSVSPPLHAPSLLPRESFHCLLETLRRRGYRILGPTVKDGAVVWGTITTINDLPVGWQDEQRPGHYRLKKTDSTRCFGIVHGPESLKRETFAPSETLLVLDRKGKSFSPRPVLPESVATAILGIRACDLAGLAIQDRIFLQDAYPDPYYQARRSSLLLIAVNCTRALDTCFCASMNTGPQAKVGYDLVLTESDDDFLVETGSERGLEIARELPLQPASSERVAADLVRMDACAKSQTRTIDQSSLPQALYDAHDHARWDEVGSRCLACTNCTMVCPTCFCHAVEDKPDLAFQQTEHVRVWDSCFTPNHGYIHGKNFRPTIKDRYRMWLTHKLASWIDQFGTSGCVGCGRCITWCPVGIDLTEELASLLSQNQTKPS